MVSLVTTVIRTIIILFTKGTKCNFIIVIQHEIFFPKKIFIIFPAEIWDYKTQNFSIFKYFLGGGQNNYL